MIQRLTVNHATKLPEHSIPDGGWMLDLALCWQARITALCRGKGLIHPIGLADLVKTHSRHIVRINEKPDTVAIHQPLRATNPRATNKGNNSRQPFLLWQTLVLTGFCFASFCFDRARLVRPTATNCSLKGKVHVFHCA